MTDHASVIRADAVDAMASTRAEPRPLTESEFQEIYRLQGRAVWAYLYRVTGNAADADDLLQDAFCRLLATPLATRDAGELRAYLYRIASNAAIDHWRRQDRRGRKEVPAGPDPAGPDPQGEIARRHDVARTLRELKPRDRLMLWLAYVEGTGHGAIAETLGLKAGSVPVLLFRARKKLAGLLRKKGLGPGER